MRPLVGMVSVVVLGACVRLGADVAVDGQPPRDAGAEAAAVDLNPIAEAGAVPGSDFGAADIDEPDEAAVVEPDFGAADLATPVPPACSSFAQAGLVTGSVAFCEAGAAGVSQCDAGELCNAAEGWALCSAAQYQARFSSLAPDRTGYWLSGCVREGGAMSAPGESPCASCAGESATKLPASFTCDGSGTAQTQQSAYVGLTSFGSCRRVGVDSPTTAAYWSTSPAMGQKAGAVCCSATE